MRRLPAIALAMVMLAGCAGESAEEAASPTPSRTLTPEDAYLRALILDGVSDTVLDPLAWGYEQCEYAEANPSIRDFTARNLGSDVAKINFYAYEYLCPIE